MKTDNKTMNKTEYAEMVRSSIDSHILSEAANHTFEKRSSRAATWAAAACFALIFAAAAIFLFKPMKERQKQALSGTASPAPTETAKTTPLVLFTPAPTPDISNMRIIYGSGDAYGVDDIVHEPGTVTLYGGLTEMLADEQYNNCIFAVDIDIQDFYLSDKHSEENDRLYAEFQNDPAVVRYNELYENFVRENADRYYEFLELYYSVPLDHQTLDDQLEELAEKYDESMVFSVAFGYYLESTEQEQILSDYAVAQDEYNKKLSELWQDRQNRPEEKELLKARHEAEVQRLKDCGLIAENYEFNGETMLRWLLTRDQLLNFPASPEFAYIITPAVNRDDAPVPTPDISNMRIIYGRADCILINDVQHKPGTVTLYGGLTEMLADEQYNNCIFAVDIDIQDSYPYSYLYDDPSEESDGLYAEFQNDPAVMRYNELYEQFVQENADRYDEFLARYHPSLSSFHSDYTTRDVEDAVFSSAFRNHLTSTGQEQFLYDYSKAEREYYSKLSQARNEAEVQRLRSLGLIVEEYKAYEHPLDSSLSSVYIEPECRIYPNMRLRCLLTRDQLLNFPASPEFAYIITPAVNGDDTPDSTEAPQIWYIAADEKEELVIDFFRCIDEERFDDLAKLIAPEERAGYEAIAALAEGSRVGVRNISSVTVKEMNPYELTDDMVFAKSLEKYVGIDGARAAYRVKLDMSVYDNTGDFADEIGETEQIVLLVKNAEEWFVGFWCLINDDQSSISEAQVEHIINLLAEYHAAQFTRSAEIGELKLSDNVLSDLEERQRCIEEMEKRICVHSGKFMNASVSVERLHIAPYYQPKNGVFECFTVLYYEITTVDYGAGAPFSFGIDHTVTIAPDGTVLYDIFSEENSTGFSNHPFPNRGIIWTDALVPDSYYTSERYQYLAAAHALLAGEVPQRTDFHYGDEQYVRFRFDGDALKAYVTVNTMITAPGSPHTDMGMDVTVAMIPREVGELAYQKLYEYWGKYVSFSEMECDLTQEFDGFVGENWFALVTPDDSMHDLQVHCIFYFDGSEWHEIIGNNGGVYINGEGTPFPHTIFGACVLDEDTAIICYYTKWFFTDGSDDGKLYIYRTENGGESWSRLDIELPDYYTNRMSYYAPLTPVFDASGQHGVIILDSGIMTNGESAPFGWLESLDGGVSWEFHSLEGRGA